MTPSFSSSTTTSFEAFPLLSQDLVVHLAAFLDGRTLMGLALCSRALHKALLLPSALSLWRDLLEQDVNGAKLLRRRAHHQQHHQQQASKAQPHDHELYGVAHRLAHLSSTKPVAWQQLPRVPAGTPNAPPPMEGHTACLLDERWMVMIGGFTRFGVRNDVFVLDTVAALDAPYPQWRRFPLPRRTEGMPVYGHVCCALSSTHVAVFGGVSLPPTHPPSP